MTKFFTTALNTVSPPSSNKDRDLAFWHFCEIPHDPEYVSQSGKAARAQSDAIDPKRTSGTR
jgi:hypothetical protein